MSVEPGQEDGGKESDLDKVLLSKYIIIFVLFFIIWKQISLKINGI